MATADIETKQALPYVSFKTFYSYIGDLKALGHLPHQIDRSVMPKMSGVTQAQMFAALRFFGLIDKSGEVTELNILVDAYDTDGWKDTLKTIVERAYAPFLDGISIEKATLKQVKDRFRELSSLDGETLEKAVRFFLKTYQDSGIKISSHLLLRQPRPSTRRASNQRSSFGAGQAAPGSLGQTAHGTITIPLHLPQKAIGSLIIPEDLEEADCDMIDAILRAYAKRRQGVPHTPK